MIFLIPRRSRFLPQNGHGYGRQRRSRLEELRWNTYTTPPKKTKMYVCPHKLMVEVDVFPEAIGVHAVLLSKLSQCETLYVPFSLWVFLSLTWDFFLVLQIIYTYTDTYSTVMQQVLNLDLDSTHHPFLRDIHSGGNLMSFFGQRISKASWVCSKQFKMSLSRMMRVGESQRFLHWNERLMRI